MDLISICPMATSMGFTFRIGNKACVTQWPCSKKTYSFKNTYIMKATYIFIYFNTFQKHFYIHIDVRKFQVLVFLFWICESHGQLKKRQPTKV
jgi:hypothetical protein